MDTDNGKTMPTVPYIAHEAAMARLEREHESAMARMEREHEKERGHYKTVIRWLCVVLLVLAVGIVSAFFYETQWEEEQTSITQEVRQSAAGKGSNNFVGGDWYGSVADY